VWCLLWALNLVVNNGFKSIFLNAVNTYTGATTVSGLGTVVASVDGAIPTTSALTVDGNLSFLTASTIGSLAGTGKVSMTGANALTAGGDDTSTTFSGVYSGANAGLTKTGLGAFTLSGINTYAGTTDVDAGTLIVNGSIVTSSLTTVGSGATLEGTGVLGATAVESGGIHAPGNSIGTQTVTGPYLLQPGAILEIEATPGTNNSDVVVVNGTVSLTGAILNVIAAGGNYAAATSYLIIDNDLADPVTGTFGQVNTNLAFLTPTVIYDGGTNNNDVILTLTRNNTAFTSLAQTPNGLAVANALGQFPTNNPLFLAVLGQSAAGAQQAFDALSGEVHASIAGMLVDESHFLRDAIFSRLLQAFYGGGPTTAMASLGMNGPTTVANLGDAPMMGLGMNDRGSSALPANGLTFWTQGFGSWGDFKGDGNAAGADRTLGGFVSGVDAGLGGTWRAGFATGYSQTSDDVDARLSSARIDSYHFALYTGGALGPLAIRSGAAWTWHDIDTDRAVLFPGFFEREKASYDGDTGQIFGEIAMPFATVGGGFEPFADLAYVHVGTGGFTESGSIAALTAGRNDEDLGYSTLGLRGAATLFVAGAQFIPHASAGWQHAYGDVTTDTALAFASPNVGFVISGVPIARDSAILLAGIDVRVSNDATIGVSYQGQLASDVEDHGISGRFDWRF
jgi:outer membrane autotransporter protein